MSDALVWHLIKDNNSFLVKRGRTSRDGAVQFSKECGNLLNVNTFKYSGLANSKAVHVGYRSDEKKRESVVACKKSFKKANQPKKAIHSSRLSNGKAHSVKVLAKAFTNKFNRPDLTDAARIRYNKLKSFVRIRAGVQKRALIKAGRNSRK